MLNTIPDFIKSAREDFRIEHSRDNTLTFEAWAQPYVEAFFNEGDYATLRIYVEPQILRWGLKKYGPVTITSEQDLDAWLIKIAVPYYTELLNQNKHFF